MPEFQNYPQGQLAIGNGQAEHVATAKLDATNNAKLVHMLAASPSGYTTGNNDLAGSLEGLVPADGEEVDYLGMVLSRKRVRFRFKIPNSVKVIDGVLTRVNYTIATGEGVAYSVDFIGKVTNA